MQNFTGLLLLSCLGFVFQVHLTCGLHSPWSRLMTDRINDEKEDWAYVKVRQDAYMFWWLYYARQNPTSAPLVIWLQGGPGGSSTGFGNFEEIGPQDVNLNPRNVTWVETANVLFIDNPVGTGYSYTTSPSAFTINNQQIADDLVTLLIAFYNRHSEMKINPLYIFSESYGGKMTAGFGKALVKAINAGKIKCNFKGVALGDSWISPVDSVNSWGPYLHSISLLDGKGLGKVNAAAKAVEKAFNQGLYKEATELWDACEEVVEQESPGINFYNILTNYGEKLSKKQKFKHLSPIENLYRKHVLRLQDGDLNALMNGPIKKKLHIPNNVTWGGQSGEVFSHLSEDFMKPVYDDVDSLFSANITVVVYNGQLDLIVDSVGTEVWVQKLKWSGLPAYNSTTWQPFSVSSDKIAGFVKSHGNFSFYWIMLSGHMVPADAPETAYKMMQLVTKLK